MINCNALKCISCHDSFKYIITHEDYGEKLELKEYNSDEVVTYYRYYIRNIKHIMLFDDGYKIINFMIYLDNQNLSSNCNVYVYTNNKNVIPGNMYQGPAVFKYWMDCNISAYKSQFFIESIYGNIIEQNPARMTMGSMVMSYIDNDLHLFGYPYSSYRWNGYHFVPDLSPKYYDRNYYLNPYHNYYELNSELFNNFLKWR